MSYSRPLLVFVTAIIAACVLSVVAVGGVAAQDTDLTVEIDPADPTFEGDGQTVEVEVTNDDDADLIFPLVEVPLRDGLEIPDDRRSVQGGTEFVDGVAVHVDGSVEDRSAFVDDSTFRTGDSLFIEGEMIEAGETRTYVFDLTVSSTNEVTIEADVRPLNNEENNVRESVSVDPVAFGTLEVTADGAIEISGNEIDETGTGSLVVDVPGGFEYDVTGELSLLDGELTIDSVGVAEYATESVAFSDADPGSATTPIVIAQTDDAEVIGNSDSRSVTRGDAETNTLQTVEFDATNSGGTAVLALEDEPTLPMHSLDSHSVHDGEWLARSDGSGVSTVTLDGDFDETVSVTLEGYPIGDVTLSGTVTDDDAATIAANLAAGDATLEYGDVTDDGEITAVDAMKIQQYHDGNRDESYDVTGGA
ncbi:dockerin type I domain-containing protein [Natrarchaeobius oligotrophus]|uniref:Dockerin domain-containing protein n=1 Tax=Natrarchaeobius chitinivorans TaxID=1679083 RepID=A0A3N6ME72_NATCH|nr:dockerin type I domain-containing protein [Natrarchaeobius chitinivorans]RQH02264.1 hypothetical protein EA472_02890 [Natrarchaeobius chitinivorans]